MDGRVIRTENWGRRRLSYPVGKKMYGIYWLVDFMGSPQLLLELERNMRIEEQIYKHMSQVLDKNFSEEKYQAEIERLKAEAAKREAERAEREAERGAARSRNDGGGHGGRGGGGRQGGGGRRGPCGCRGHRGCRGIRRRCPEAGR